MQNIKSFDTKPYMTIGIIVVNIIVFVLMSLSGSTLDAQYMAAHGAMYPEYIKDGQYWRLLTSMFMHFGLMHILNNMVVLGAVGQIVEKAMGHVKLLITFLVSGICGSVLSYIFMLYNNDFAVSAGASGAIFGLVGALVWIVIANRGFYEGISRQQAVFMVILMIYYGVSTQGDKRKSTLIRLYWRAFFVASFCRQRCGYKQKILRTLRLSTQIRRIFGATDLIRTGDLLITSELLYQLSHSSTQA